MFQEDLARMTADHLREHIADYLVQANAAHTDHVTLVVPKTIEAASNVGGTAEQFDQILPAYAIDILQKTISPNPDNLYTFEYAGHIAGMINGGSQDSVDKLVKRHARACEQFVREHNTLPLSHSGFKVLEFAFINSATAGAEEVEDGKWVDAFKIDVIWVTSEDGSFQHG